MKWEYGTRFTLLQMTINNLLQIREKMNRAIRLYKAQILETKNGEVIPYSRSVFEERTRQTKKEMQLKDSKNQFLICNSSKKGVPNPLFF